jgi:LysR family glycine cleavage system transcriptional activator
MTWSGIPSLNALKAFAAVAESGSFSQAGTDLNVSHAAVSQQVKSLEARLGVTLVVREGRGIALTAEGEALARDLLVGFTTIRRGVEALTGVDATRPVQITTSPAFALRWLMPRIMDFQLQHPEITLMLNPTAEVMELKPGGIDLAIRYRDNRKPKTEVTPVLISDMVVVAAAALIDKQKITGPAVFTDLPWLQELGTDEVAEWMERHGITPKKQMKIIHMPGNLIMEAVRRGDGLTYTPRPFVEEEIRSGHLMELSSEKNAGGFYAVTRPGVLRPPVQTFLKWLKHEAAAEAATRV